MAALNLAKLQKVFKKELLKDEPSQALERLNITETANFSLSQRFGVYHYAVGARLKEAVAEDFPDVKRVVGEKEFENLLESYIKKNPSHYSSLNELSENFPLHLKGSMISKKFPFLYDLALLEWTKIMAGFEPENQKCEDLKNLDLENFLESRLVLSGSTFLLKSVWNIVGKFERTQTYVAVFSNNGDVQVRELSKGEFEILENISKDKKMGKVLSRYKTDDLQKKFSNWFQEWARLGIIIGFLNGGRENDNHKTVSATCH